MSDTPFKPIAPSDKPRPEIVEVKPQELTLSRWNPRQPIAAAGPDPELDELVASIRRQGQLVPAIAMRCPGGSLELIAGSRRHAAALRLDIPLRVEIHPSVSDRERFKLAQAENEGRQAVSLWEQAQIYRRGLDQGLFQNDLELAQSVGADKSVVSRTLALARAPLEILRLFRDPREISARQWWAFSPLLRDAETRERILDRAALLEGRTMSAPIVFAELTKAAVGQSKPQALEVRNSHGRRIAQIKKSAKGALNISVTSMAELHPDQRKEWVKLLSSELAGYVARAFNG